ncbi:SGNH/GDSL hydrolase family protein [Pseudomonas denitrificans (nom. rej.)]|nr:SGNH/GDSL hydrolase family protein [Pseudomonas denitrificans (nom. rej.)]
MRYNTGNAVEPNGSSDPRDLFDNAGNLDLAVNGQAVSWTDRTGKSRKSFAGMEADFQTALANTGYIYVGPYAAGLSLTLPNQVFDRAGEFWRAKPGVTLPLTLTGTWATDQNNVVSVGDAALRSELAAITGATKVGYRQAGRTVYTKLLETPSIADQGAGVGITNNKALIEAAIAEAGNPGTVLVPEGEFRCASEPSNPLGVRYIGPGAIMVPTQNVADGYRQINTYADSNEMGIGLTYNKRPYDYFALGQSGSAGTLKVFVYGDSTVAGGNGESANFGVKPLLERIFAAKGLANVLVTNRAVSGKQIVDMQAPAVADLASGPGLYILKSFINEGTQTLATRLADTRTQLVNWLTAVRAGTGGGIGSLTIVVMGPNATNNTRYQRDATWYEQLRGMIISVCKQFGAVYFDTYRILQDVMQAAAGTGTGLMDAPYSDRLQDCVHPLNAMNAMIWGRFMQWLLPDETLYPYRTNNVTNSSAQVFTFSNSAPPSDYQFGFHHYRATLAGGAPAEGFVLVFKNPDGGVLMELYPFGANDSRLLTRTANVSGNSWNQWTGEVKGPSGFTFLNGWADYNDGNVVTSASYVLTTEGYVELFGMIKGGTVTDGTAVAQLPAGYRPLNPENAITYSSHTQGFAVWSVTPNGNIVCAKGLAVGGVSLAGIKFRRGN